MKNKIGLIWMILGQYKIIKKFMKIKKQLQYIKKKYKNSRFIHLYY